MHCVGFDIASPKLAVSEINLSADTGMRKYEMARRQCSAIACVCSNVIFCKEKINSSPPKRATRSCSGK